MLAYAYTHGMGWGWGILMTLGWLALLALFLSVVLGAVRDRRSPSAREILDRRLAAGEINIDEYESARAAMSPDRADLTPAGPPAITSPSAGLRRPGAGMPR